MNASAPFWADVLDDAPPIGVVALGARPRRVHTAVIGAGLTGLSAAYHLLLHRPDREVAILEATRVGAGASTRSTGMLTPGVGQNLAGLVRRVGHDMARGMYQASLRAVDYVHELTAAEGIDCELTRSGQLIVSRAHRGRQRLAAQARAYRDLDLPCEVLDDAALAAKIRLAPAPARADGLPAALRLPDAGTLHPGKLVRGLLEAVRRRGGTVYEDARVTEVARDRPSEIRLAEGAPVIADEVVLATAGYTADLRILRGRILPVQLCALATEPLGAATLAALGWHGREAIIDSRRLFNYFRLTSDDRIVFGGGAPRYAWGGGSGDGSGQRALAKLRAELALTPARGWTGVIGYVADAMPVIQRLAGRPSIVHVGGWCGHGIALGVASGAWVAHLLTGDGPPEALAWFRDRAPLVPTELIRWLSFRTAVSMMAFLDRV